MPSKNSEKYYIGGGYYHIYNRGVEKRIIFQDEQDYGVFLSYLKVYLLPRDDNHLRKQLSLPNIPWSEKDKILKQLKLNNFYQTISLVCYCLMPNHFHLLIQQHDETSIDSFMNSLCTRYSMYFNKKYHRVGPLYQGVYKAILVQSDQQLLHLTRYIHKNPLSLQGVALQTLSNQHSSYPEYIGTRDSTWIDTKQILAYFSNKNPYSSYRSFVNECAVTEEIQSLLIDDELLEQSL